jgi:hypothetical protein
MRHDYVLAEISRVQPLQDRASLLFADIRGPRDTPIWKLEASLKCRSCRKGRYAPAVHMINLTETREIDGPETRS